MIFYLVMTSANISALFQRCCLLGWYDIAMSQNLKQRWNKVVFANVETCNIEQRRSK